MQQRWDRQGAGGLVVVSGEVVGSAGAMELAVRLERRCSGMGCQSYQCGACEAAELSLGGALAKQR